MVVVIAWKLIASVFPEEMQNDLCFYFIMFSEWFVYIVHQSISCWYQYYMYTGWNFNFSTVYNYFFAVSITLFLLTSAWSSK